jgi:hypothetical protein
MKTEFLADLRLPESFIRVARRIVAFSDVDGLNASKLLPFPLMNDFFRDLISPGWWLGVVVVSFLVNLAAAYVKPFIDSSTARISDRKRRKLKETEVELDRQLEII